RVVGDLQICAMETLGGVAVVDADELDDQAGRLVPAPLHPNRAPARALDEELGAGCEAVGEVRQGSDLDGPLDAEGAEHLTDLDHRFATVPWPGPRTRACARAARRRGPASAALRCCGRP